MASAARDAIERERDANAADRRRCEARIEVLRQQAAPVPAKSAALKATDAAIEPGAGPDAAALRERLDALQALLARKSVAPPRPAPR